MRRAAFVMLVGLAAAGWLACSEFSSAGDAPPATEGGADTAGPTGDGGDSGDLIDSPTMTDAADAGADGARRVVFEDHFENGTCGAWQATGGTVDAVMPGRNSNWACLLCRVISGGDLHAYRFAEVTTGAGTYQLEFYASRPDGGAGGALAGMYVYYDGGIDNDIASTAVPLPDWTRVQITDVAIHDATTVLAFAFSNAGDGDCMLFDDATLYYYPP